MSPDKRGDDDDVDSTSSLVDSKRPGASAPTSRLSVTAHILLALAVCTLALLASTYSGGRAGLQRVLDTVVPWRHVVVDYETVCGGNGIILADSTCFCDLGWTGDECATSISELPVAPVQPNSILFIVDAFGELVGSTSARSLHATALDDALMYDATVYDVLATKMADTAAVVSVLYVGDVETADDKKRLRGLTSFYEKRGVELTVLPKLRAAAVGSLSDAASRAYAVYRYLTTPGVNTFSVVQAPVHSGVLHYILQARAQGFAAFPHTSFVTHCDSLPQSLMERWENSDEAGVRYGHSYGGSVAAVTETLTREFMAQKSAEQSDRVVFGSQAVADFVTEELGWTIAQSLVLPEAIKTLTVKPSAVNNAKATVLEFVFVGTPQLSVSAGLKVVLNALDLFKQSPTASKSIVQLTFLGQPTQLTSPSMSTQEFIDLRSYNWPHNIQWQIVQADTFGAIAAYLQSTESGTQKMAVVPHITTTAAVSGYLVQMLMANKIPFLAARTDPISERVMSVMSADSVAIDDDSFMFEANSTSALSQIMLATLKTFRATSAGQQPFKPVASKSVTVDAVAQWRSQLYVPLFESTGSAMAPSRNFFSAQTSMQDLPVVSIVLVHHNRAELVKQAIQSIELQTYPQDKIEVVLVDDGSTDSAATQFINDLAWKWWETKGWKVVREPQRWLGASRNTGVSHARGDFIVFLDDDDVAKPQKIEMMIKVALTTNADVVTAGHDVFNSRDYPQTTGTASRASGRFIPVGGDPVSGMFRNVYGDSSFLTRRSFFVDVGGFTEDFGVGFEDYEFLAKVSLLDNARIASIPEALTWYRKLTVATAMTQNTELKENQVRMMRPFVARYPFQAHWQQNLLKLAQGFLFAHGTLTDNPFEAALLNTTVSSTMHMTSATTTAISSSSMSLSSSSIVVAPSTTATSASQTVAASSSSSSRSSSSISSSSSNYATSSSASLVEIATSSVHATSSSGVEEPQAASTSVAVAAESSSVQDEATRTAVDIIITPSAVAEVSSSSSSHNEPATSTVEIIVTPASSSSQVAAVSSSDQAASSSNSQAAVGSSTSSASQTMTSAQLQPSPTPVSTACAVKSQDCTGKCPGDPLFNQVTSDVCGVCGGDGKSCIDCQGKLFGTARVDNCNICGGDNSQCFALASVQPRPLVNRGGVSMLLTGAGFDVTTNKVYVNGQRMTGVTARSRSILVVKIGTPTPFDSFFVDNPTIFKADFPVYVEAAGATKTAVKNVTVYRDVARVSGVSPTLVKMAATSAVITVSGQALLPFDTMRCWFNYTQRAWNDDFTAQIYRPYFASTAATFVSATAVTCPSPALDESTTASVWLSFSGTGPTDELIGWSAVLPAANNVLTFAAPAPQILSTRLDDAGTFTFVTFDTATNGPDLNATTCATLFDVAAASDSDPQYAKLSSGLATDCRFRFVDPYTVGVTVSADFAAQFPLLAPAPGKIIRFASGVLKRAGERYFDYFSGDSLPIAAPLAPVAPQVDVQAASNLGACSAYAIDMSASTGGGGRYFTRANFTVAIQGHAGSQAEMALNALMSTLAGRAVQGDLFYQLPFQFFPVSAVYTFTLQLGNFMGPTATQVLTVQVDTQSLIPDIRVVGPSRGVAYRESAVKLSTLLQFNADPVCLAALNLSDPGPVTISWSLVTPALGPMATYRPSWVSKSGVALTIAPYAFEPGQPLTFQSEVLLQKTGRRYQVQYQLTYQYGELLAGIAGGSRQLYYALPLTMSAELRDATWSNKKEQAKHLTEYQLQWSCAVIASSGQSTPCVDRRSGQPLAVGPGLAFTLPAGSLMATDLTDSYYSFSLVAQHPLSGRQSGGSVLYRFMTSAGVPQVRVVISSLNTPARDPAFSLSADVTGTTNVEDLEYIWLAQAKCDGRPYDTLPLSDASILAAAPNGPVLAFRTDPPALKAGGRYCVDLLVRRKSDPTQVGKSTAVFAVRQEPDYGSCRVVGATTGEALKTEFLFRCGQWQTDPLSGSIWYTFYQRSADGKRLKQLGSRTKSGTYALTFGQVGTHTVVVVVSDDAGGRVRDPPTMQVTVTDGGVDASEYAKQSQASFRQSKNPQAGLKSCGSASGAVTKKSTTSGSSHFLGKRQLTTSSSLASTLIAFVTDLVDQSVVDYDDVGPMVQSLITQLVDGGTTTAESLALLQLVSTVTTRMNDNGHDMRACFTPAVAADILAAVAQLVAQLQPEYDDTVNSLRPAIIQSLTACMQRQTVCGATPLLLAAGNGDTAARMTVGSVDASAAESTVGIFSLAQLGQSVQAATGECLHYYYGVDNSRMYVTGNDSIDQSVYVLEFRNATVNTAGPPVDGDAAQSDHVDTATLSPPVVFRLPVVNQSLAANLATPSAYQPSCAFYKRLAPDYTTGQWDTTGCSVLNFTSAYVTCQCTHLTEFAVRVDAVRQQPIPPPDPVPTVDGGQPTAAVESSATPISTIIGASCGFVAVVALASLLLVRRSKARRAAATGAKVHSVDAPAPVVKQSIIERGVPVQPMVVSRQPLPPQPTPNAMLPVVVELRQHQQTRAEATVSPSSNASSLEQLQRPSAAEEITLVDGVAVAVAGTIPAATGPAELPPYLMPPSYNDHVANVSDEEVRQVPRRLS